VQSQPWAAQRMRGAGLQFAFRVFRRRWMTLAALSVAT
jgi:hypothetical protein